MKKLISRFLVMALIVSTIFCGQQPINVSAATKTENAYAKFVRQQIRTGKYAKSVQCNTYDFNNDGVKELMVWEIAARAKADIYTYYKGKVVYLTDANETYSIKGGKYLVCGGSGSSSLQNYVVYSIKNGKAKKVSTYESDNGVYKKGNKKISKKEFDKFTTKLVTVVGDKLDTMAGTFYSAKQAGFSMQDIRTRKEIVIDKVTKDKITYHEQIFDDDAGEITYTGKTQTAKITSKTKFYYGCNELFFNSKKDADERKWLEKLNRNEFVAAMKNYRDVPNLIKTQNGVATVIAVSMHLAD